MMAMLVRVGDEEIDIDELLSEDNSMTATVTGHAHEHAPQTQDHEDHDGPQPAAGSAQPVHMPTCAPSSTIAIDTAPPPLQLQLHVDVDGQQRNEMLSPPPRGNYSNSNPYKHTTHNNAPAANLFGSSGASNSSSSTTTTTTTSSSASFLPPLQKKESLGFDFDAVRESLDGIAAVWSRP
jgi:hypothetical protein